MPWKQSAEEKEGGSGWRVVFVFVLHADHAYSLMSLIDTMSSFMSVTRASPWFMMRSCSLAMCATRREVSSSEATSSPTPTRADTPSRRKRQTLVARMTSGEAQASCTEPHMKSRMLSQSTLARLAMRPLV